MLPMRLGRRGMSKYLDYIKDVAEGKTDKYLAEYLNPAVKDTKWFKKYKTVRENQMKVNLELSERK